MVTHLQVRKQQLPLSSFQKYGRRVSLSSSTFALYLCSVPRFALLGLLYVKLENGAKNRFDAREKKKQFQDAECLIRRPLDGRSTGDDDTTKSEEKKV
jgi:hypothetical protein